MAYVQYSESHHCSLSRDGTAKHQSFDTFCHTTFCWSHLPRSNFVYRAILTRAIQQLSPFLERTSQTRVVQSALWKLSFSRILSLYLEKNAQLQSRAPYVRATCELLSHSNNHRRSLIELCILASQILCS